jgi:hypothetical protein
MEQDACSEGNKTLVLNFWILCTNETIFSLSFVLNTLVIGYDALSDHPWGVDS